MDKDLATFRLGGSEAEAARWIGISAEVYREWPEVLLPVMTDRIYAAVIRKETAKALGVTAKQFFTDFRCETVVESMISRVSLAAVMINLMGKIPPEYARTDTEDMPHKRRGKRSSINSKGTPIPQPAAG